MNFHDDAVRFKIRDGVIKDIDDYWAKKRPNRQAVRISPSSIGEECAAQSWYRWRWATEPKPADGRMARYNSRGEDNEKDFIEWLRATGWTVLEIDEKTNTQFAIHGFYGHLYGKCDSIASHPVYTEGQFILLEYKYINYKRFTTLTNKPLIEADFKYYCQVCIYMDYLGLPACMFLPSSRNDDDFRPVIIPADPAQVRVLEAKINTVMTSKVRPARIAESSAFYKCKLCDYAGPCHHNQPLPKSCRSCVFCVPTNDGKFGCEHWGQVIPKDVIKVGCDKWDPVK